MQLSHVTAPFPEANLNPSVPQYSTNTNTKQ